ncbi:MAG: chitooligosaccharide deacetylase, partial [Planctomycetota bacterium]
MGYRYDASIFPTSLAPVARAYFLMTSQLKDEARKRASQMYGGFQSALQPNRPFMRSIPAVEPSSDDQDPASEQDRGDAGSLCEIPVSVMPITRTPIHFSYFLFLASFSKLAAKAYFRKAMMLFRMTGGPPSLLLHPPDFLGVEDDSDMAFFPGMKMPRDAKLDLMRWALGHLARQFHVVRMRQQTEQFYQQHAG